ncbi:hypothetical protein D3C81_1136850 [compost metagenome]
MSVADKLEKLKQKALLEKQQKQMGGPVESTSFSQPNVIEPEYPGVQTKTIETPNYGNTVGEVQYQPINQDRAVYGQPVEQPRNVRYQEVTQQAELRQADHRQYNYAEQPTNIHKSNTVPQPTMSDLVYLFSADGSVKRDEFGNPIVVPRSVAVALESEMKKVPVIQNSTGNQEQSLVPVNNLQKSHLIETLKLDPTVNIDIYRPQTLSVEPISFKEIRDRKGSIAERVEQFEKKHKISCIPFKAIPLNNNVVQILGYNIFEMFGMKYASALDHQVNERVVKDYEEKWKQIIQDGGIVNEELIVDVEIEGETYKTVLFNTNELNYLLARFQEVDAVALVSPDSYRIVAGV